MMDDHEPAVVSLEQPRDRAYWARRFEVPTEAVENAVKAVGNDPMTVAEHLGKSWPPTESGIV